MFPFKKPPSRAQVAQKAVASAVSGAADSLSVHAHELLEGAHNWIEGALESAHEALETAGEKVEGVAESSPLEKAKTVAGLAATGVAAGAAKTAADVTEKFGALKAGTATSDDAASGDAATGVAASLSAASQNVAGRIGDGVAALRSTGEGNDQIPDVKRARKQAQKEIDNMNKEAVKYQRELEKQLARDQQTFLAEQQRMEREHEQLQKQLEQARAEANAQAQQNGEEQEKRAKRQRKFDEKNDIVRVPIAPTDEVVAVGGEGYGGDDYDEEDYDYDEANYRYENEGKRGGGNGWLLAGGLLLAGAGAVYYLFSSTEGKRKRAQIQDRVGQVADGVREKVTHDSDETGEATSTNAGVEEVIEAATEFADRSNEKILDADEFASDETVVIEANLPPTGATLGETKGATSGPTFPDKAVETLEEVSDKVADGIASAGAFLADKLEAAGAGAKNAAHSAAEKLDDAKGKAAAKLDDVKNSPALNKTAAPENTPNAVVVDAVIVEPVKGESTEEILAEVEATVRNIENSARESKS